jgi:hypothetical protein
MVEHHLKGPSMAERIAARGKNSGAGANPAISVQNKEGWNHNIHPFGFHGATGANAPTDGRVANNPSAKTQGSGGNQ